mgnify:CR=1 FL=1
MTHRTLPCKLDWSPVATNWTLNNDEPAIQRHADSMDIQILYDTLDDLLNKTSTIPLNTIDPALRKQVHIYWSNVVRNFPPRNASYLWVLEVWRAIITPTDSLVPVPTWKALAACL